MKSPLAAAVLLVGALLSTTGWAAEPVDIGKAAPEIARGEWVNSPPLTIAGLRGRVVLVEFWTYG